MTLNKEIFVGGLVTSLVVIGLVVLFFLSPETMTGDEPKETKIKEAYKEIVNPSGFVNIDTITLGELIGKKIILVDFLTYSCINCQRTFPYLNLWYEKYKDQGLEIVGIHTPEFAFEKDITNVREAMARFGIIYPIVLDNNYATWNAYGNRYWPRKYLINIDGNIVYDHIGEGAYEETERKIQELLKERAEFLGQKTNKANDTLVSTSVPKKEYSTRSPETYFGSLRNEYLANGVPGRSGEQTSSVPENIRKDALYLSGTWNITPEYAEATMGAGVVYKYNAKEVYIVADSDMPITVEVIQDGKIVNVAAGADVNKDGTAVIKESRLYKLISNKEPAQHTLELKIKGRGIRLYAFTFG